MLLCNNSVYKLLEEGRRGEGCGGRGVKGEEEEGEGERREKGRSGRKSGTREGEDGRGGGKRRESGGEREGRGGGVGGKGLAKMGAYFLTFQLTWWFYCRNTSWLASYPGHVEGGNVAWVRGYLTHSDLFMDTTVPV